MFCLKCGAEINSEAQFCSQCGAKVAVPNPQNQASSAPSAGAVSATAEVADNVYKICAALAAVCGLLLLTNWISFPILSSAASIAGSLTGSSTSYSAEYTIPGLFMTAKDVLFFGAENDMYGFLGSGDFSVLFLALALLSIAWLCALVYIVISVVASVQKRTIFDTYLIGAFSWSLATSLTCIVAVFIANSVLSSSAGSIGLSSITYISTTLWAWLAAIASGGSLAFLLDAQKKQRLKKKKSRN